MNLIPLCFSSGTLFNEMEMVEAIKAIELPEGVTLHTASLSVAPAAPVSPDTAILDAMSPLQAGPAETVESIPMDTETNPIIKEEPEASPEPLDTESSQKGRKAPSNDGNHDFFH